MTKITEDYLRKLDEELAKMQRAKEENRLSFYAPYAKQVEFHKLGATYTERLLSAGNQLGKTVAGAHEAAYHATGLYPAWWRGRKWDRPTRGWVGGESSTVIRDTSQKMLLGDISEDLSKLGTGLIPKELIVSYTLARGVAQGVDTVVIKHVSGKGNSVIKFKSYEMQRQKWQGDTIDWAWFDEEPPPDIYSEGLARFTATDGMAWMTFTPLKGMSTVVKRFKKERTKSRIEVVMTASDAKHITPELLEKMKEKYPEHELDCRINGVPMHGEGRIFTASESIFTVDPIAIPGYWKHVIGLDLGHGQSEQAHPTAAVWMAIDPDTDVVYIYDCYRVRGGNIPTHASALRRKGNIVVAWPHDAHSGDKASGKAVADHYRAENVRMLPGHAVWPDGSISVWAGVVDIQNRIEGGQFKVFRHCAQWFEEYRNYHMENGKIVPIDDDLLSATRYALMMKRFARPIDTKWRAGVRQGEPRMASGLDYNPLG